MICNFDANACYGLLEEVKTKLSSYNDRLFNPSSIHSLGQDSRIILEDSRTQISKLIGADRNARVVFTSGSTEANNMAILAPFQALLKTLGPEEERKKYALITSSVEHPSVLQAAEEVRSYGFTVVYIGVQKDGQLDYQAAQTALDTYQVPLLSFMGANNETGHVFESESFFKKVKENHPQTLIHSDFVQLVGKAAVDLSAMSVDSISVSGHKVGALTGIGALALKDKNTGSAYLFGGPQEMHLRAGTENLLGAASFGIAAETVLGQLKSRIKSLSTYKKRVLDLIEEVPDLEVLYGSGDNYLPNTISLRVPASIADDLVAALDIDGVKVSSGAGCASGKPDPSHVLLALGHSRKEAKEVLRLSFCAEYKESDFKKGLIVLKEHLSRAVSRSKAA